jgi:hypothetical protein
MLRPVVKSSQQLKITGLLVLIVCVFALIVHTNLAFFDHPVRQLFVGAVSMASLISMFASLLAVMVRLNLQHEFLSNQEHVFSSFLLLLLGILGVQGFGDPDRMRGVHALLPIPLHVPDECILRTVWASAA